jgi:hypothetical protein
MGALTMTRTRLAPLILALLAACGDNLPPLAEGTFADAGGGTPDAAPTPDSGPTTATAFAVATDFFTTGVASTIAIPALDVTAPAIEGVASTDPVARLQGDHLFVVNRFNQDNITILDPARLTLVDQISTGAGSNPQDAARVGDRLYVAALAAPGLLVIDLTRPDQGVVDTIDLSRFDPKDGLPDCASVVAVGDQIVAVCSVLDETFTPRGPGQVALIAGDKVVDTVPMTQVRPFGLAQAAGDSVLITTVLDFADLDAGGCVERIAIGKGTLEASGCLVENADLGGMVSALAPNPSGDSVWMTVTTSFDEKDFGPRGDLVSLPAGGEPARVDLPEEVRPMDLAVCPTGHLVISDATRGVRVLAPGAERELTSAPLDIGLPPVSNGLVCY